MKLAFALVTALMSVNAHAALSGYYDSAKKIETVMSNSTVANSLRQAAIKKIEVNGLNVTIETDSCTRGVTLIAIPPQGLGATQYEVESLTMNQCN